MIIHRNEAKAFGSTGGAFHDNRCTVDGSVLFKGVSKFLIAKGPREVSHIDFHNFDCLLIDNFEALEDGLGYSSQQSQRMRGLSGTSNRRGL